MKELFAKWIIWFAGNYFLYSLFTPKKCDGVECFSGLVDWDIIFSLVILNGLVWALYILFTQKKTKKEVDK